MYNISQQEIEKKPEIRIGNKIYTVDSRLSTFLNILKKLESQNEKEEINIIIGEALGQDALNEIIEFDFSYSIMQDIIILILAAIQNIDIKEAKERFKK